MSIGLIMKTLYIALVAMGLVSACGAPSVKRDSNGNPIRDPRVEAIVKEFEADYNLDIAYLPISLVNKLDTENPRTVGLCYNNVASPRDSYIEIRRSYWEDEANEYDKKTLIYHELGHCVFDRRHKEDKDANGCPVSYMYPSVVSAFCIAINPAHYINELGQ